MMEIQPLIYYAIDVPFIGVVGWFNGGRVKKKNTAGTEGSADVQMSCEDARRHGKIDLAVIRKTTEADIRRHALEDGNADVPDKGPIRLMYEGPNVKELRTKLGLSQEAFSERFGISLRTLQQWEQDRRLPDGQAALLLRVIERSPNLVASVVRSKTPQTHGAPVLGEDQTTE